MAVLDPEELFQQAELLIRPRQPGPPRQVDVRRAISASYYGVFHCLAAAVADEFVGKTKRGDRRYAMLYRSVDHAQVKTICNAMQSPRSDVASLLPSGAFGRPLRQFGATFVELQVLRHEADYDPSRLLRTATVILAVSRARQALLQFTQAASEERRVFLTLLVVKQRR